MVQFVAVARRDGLYMLSMYLNWHTYDTGARAERYATLYIASIRVRRHLRTRVVRNRDRNIDLITG